MKPETVKSYPPGKQATQYACGDFILTHTHNLAGKAIRFGQALKFRGKDRPYAYWNHAALITNVNGDIVEALTRTGATAGNIVKYAHEEYTLVRVYASIEDQQQIFRFAEKIKGEPYGFLNDMSVFLSYITGCSLSVGFQGQVMCSGLVARAEERMGAYFSKLAENCAPADLARYYSVVEKLNEEM